MLVSPYNNLPHTFLCSLSGSASRLSDVIKLLLSRGADPSMSTIPLQPVFYAVLAGEVELVQKLLKAGAKPMDCLPDEVRNPHFMHEDNCSTCPLF